MPVRFALTWLLGVNLILTGCSALAATTASPSAAPTLPATAGSATPASDPTMSVPSMPPDKDGPNDLTGFDCTAALQFRVAGSDAAGPISLVDVRIGGHDRFDRIVFETDGAGAYDIERGVPPFYQDGSGRELSIPGESFFRVRLPGTTKQLPDGSISYDGPTSLAPTGLAEVVSVQQGGDFEAVSTWYVGVRGPGACMRVTTLEEPNRLVIDIAQLAPS